MDSVFYFDRLRLSICTLVVVVTVKVRILKASFVFLAGLGLHFEI